MNAPAPPPAEESERLRADRRLLGRLLGEVIRSQSGESALALIESIRRAAVALRRDHATASDAATTARRELAAALNGLSIDDTLNVARAFSYFLHLVNLAEDAAAPAGDEGDLARALNRVREQGCSGTALVDWFAAAVVAPVLTAHPTEVQRQSILDCERRISQLIAEPATAAREILRLWLTAMLRLTRLTVADEIANGLAYFRLTFLPQLPLLYADLEALLGREFAMAPPALASFLRVGTWIGGDRDGNPNVDAGVLTQALDAQARLACEHYLAEVRLLNGELSLAARLSPVPAELLTFAAAAGDTSPHRGDEPYRRALTGIYARLAATGALPSPPRDAKSETSAALSPRSFLHARSRRQAIAARAP